MARAAKAPWHCGTTGASSDSLILRSYMRRYLLVCRRELIENVPVVITKPGQEEGSAKVPKPHPVDAVGNQNLGVFTIVEIALKFTNAVPPTYFIP
jgi:hypothetical protein